MRGEKRYEVWEGDILRASQNTYALAKKYYKKGRIIKYNPNSFQI